MSYSDIVGSISGLLQFAVAFYALRVSQRFGLGRVGWCFCGAFSLLALAHIILSVHPFGIHLEYGAAVNFLYDLISVLLLATIAQSEVSLWKLRQKGREEPEPPVSPQSPAEPEAAEVQKALAKTEQERAELASANQQLQESVTRLAVELQQQQQAHEQAEKSHQDEVRTLRKSEEALRVLTNQLQAKLAEQQQLPAQLEKACQDQLNAVSEPEAAKPDAATALETPAPLSERVPESTSAPTLEAALNPAAQLVPEPTPELVEVGKIPVKPSNGHSGARKRSADSSKKTKSGPAVTTLRVRRSKTASSNGHLSIAKKSSRQALVHRGRGR